MARTREYPVKGEPRRAPTPPGEILSEMYLKPNGIGIGRFAKAIGYSRKHVSAVINGRSRFDAEFAARVGKALGTSTELWIGLQGATDAYKADRATRNWKPAERFAPAAAHD